MTEKTELPNWRAIKIQKMSGGGFLAATYPQDDGPIRPVAERAFSTAQELHDWLADVLGTAYASAGGWEEPGEGPPSSIMHKLRGALAWG